MRTTGINKPYGCRPTPSLRTSVMVSANAPSWPSVHSLIVVSREPVRMEPSGVMQSDRTCKAIKDA